jgi:hypothetical protein
MARVLSVKGGSVEEVGRAAARFDAARRTLQGWLDRGATVGEAAPVFLKVR